MRNLQAIQEAKERAEKAEQAFQAFIIHRFNSPEQYHKLMLEAEAAYGSYAELRAGTQ